MWQEFVLEFLLPMVKGIAIACAILGATICIHSSMLISLVLVATLVKHMLKFWPCWHVLDQGFIVWKIVS